MGQKHARPFHVHPGSGAIPKVWFGAILAWATAKSIAGFTRNSGRTPTPNSLSNRHSNCCVACLNTMHIIFRIVTPIFEMIFQFYVTFAFRFSSSLLSTFRAYTRVVLLYWKYVQSINHDIWSFMDDLVKLIGHNNIVSLHWWMLFFQALLIGSSTFLSEV